MEDVKQGLTPLEAEKPLETDEKTEKVDKSDEITLEMRFEELAKVVDTQKKEISGLSKANTELIKTKKDLELSKLSEEERIKQQLEDTKLETARIKQEGETILLDRTIDTQLYKHGLKPEEFKTFITGTDEETVEKQILLLKDKIKVSSDSEAEKEVRSRLGIKQPVGGQIIKELSYEESVKRASQISKGSRYSH